MLIKSLRLLNFRQFKGATSVEFSCDPERNVTIILGDNTFGKTTLLQAFNWCFYGTVMFDDNPDVLLNLEVANDMNNGDTANVSVEICVIHDGTEYIITRTQQYECMVMLLDKSVDLPATERVDRAFRYDTQENRQEEFKQNLALFHDYVRGGVEVM